MNQKDFQKMAAQLRYKYLNEISNGEYGKTKELPIHIDLERLAPEERPIENRNANERAKRIMRTAFDAPYKGLVQKKLSKTNDQKICSAIWFKEPIILNNGISYKVIKGCGAEGIIMEGKKHQVIVHKPGCMAHQYRMGLLSIK